MILRRVFTTAAVAGTAAVLCAPALSFAAPAPSTAPAASSAAAIAQHELAQMSLTQKIEQMFVVNVYGSSATTTDPADVTANHAIYGANVSNGADLINTYHPGGIIYFAWTDSLADPQQIGALSNGLQQAAVAADGIPLQLSTDQEGGIVTRITSGAVSPGNMAIGATFNPVTAYQTAATAGAELKSMGITMDDAPVVDVNTNPQNAADGPRSFGDNTIAVSAMAASAVAGYQSQGIAAQAKHFPGLGDTTTNTDDGVAVTSETKQQIMNTDVPSFRAAMAAGTQSVMAAHIVAPSLDPSGLPASMSQPIVTGLLRDTLHYNGIVITDSLNAAALNPYTHQQIITDAINAGDDELLLCPGATDTNPVNLPESVQIVQNDVADGTISEARINQSAYRILLVKAEQGLSTHNQTTPAAITAAVGTPAHMAVMAGAAQHSITLVRNNAHALPLATGKHVLVTGWGVSTTSALAADLTAKGETVQTLWTGSPGSAAIASAVAAAQNNDVTVVTTDNAWGDPTQVNLVNALLATGKPVVVAAVGGPYDLSYVPNAGTFVAAYDYQPVSLTALANTLTGTNPTGHLPVTVRSVDGKSVLAKYGTGLRY